MNAARPLIVACAVLLTYQTEAAQREQVCLNGIWMIHIKSLFCDFSTINPLLIN